ncbi:hypothetical protein D8B26_005893 [Coccidioides posadasii str. Silveira]|uniref:Nuclear mRNA splicing factor-associated protein n=3 Tax=Coccidioides posadasii TaxID=199306 RepID=E9DID8_COCPS|nr:RNA recognition motif family protein [Coccidioides posadasii C735 delta SOWgp]EER27980.1 RNA recognition motif family protein [Coccidioides posadasii C735 delta SOWgp]EFW13934.1 nuclear mRNA splicing factor-associated protein [Coccidioides posadasii str. Silveira]KMM67976.1 U2 snRNP-associated protein Uap2 [Coccidioides posadasii RMSCC 3488]QVM11240.1 hypothetical protein D8B26_005893 [Coccidioides posadasii str. Silveira]|eukprot:XP_003070125.1 RNA recognition motif family protein [Coccidioides posadasii C735 delta SOWgp]
MDEPPSLTAESAHRPSFPTDPSQFDSDPRISFSKLDNKFILETEDGEEYSYDTVLKRWIPWLDDSLVEQQREAYKVKGVDENEPAVKQQRKKRKQNDDGAGNNTHKAKKPRTNTAVYVTSIPLDATVDEINDVFCKCGVIAEEIDSHRPRIKMYTDENGNFKGDALVVYFRPESVNLAIQMLDDSDFRFGEPGPQGKMKVQQADFSFKAQQEAPEKPNARDKAKIIRKTQKLKNKLADWDEEDAATQPSGRWEKVVILKHMFTLQELEEDPAAILDIKEDIRDECSKLGEVTNVVMYDKEESGVVTVRFKDPDAAQACVRMMHGRFFGGTQVEAYIADGRERFKKSSTKGHDYEDDGAGWEVGNDDEEARRLEEFGSWIENKKAEPEATTS